MRMEHEKGGRAIGHSRGGATTKIHALVDAWGRPVQFALTEGQTHEMKAAGSLLAEVANAFVVGDRAYDATSLREQLKKQGCQVVIPSNPTRKVQRRYDRTLYKLRHRVENFFQRLERFRRIATRYEKLAASYYAMVCFAAVLIWLP
jgi:transposase